MNLSREIFWDTDYNTINWNKHRQWVICRVLEYGSLNDWKQIKKNYGTEEIIKAAINARSLSLKTFHFISNIFDIPLKKFRCYTSMHFDPLRWMY